MNIVSTANLSITRIYTSARARVYCVFSRLDQTSAFLVKAGRPLSSAGNPIEGREMLRNVTGEIGYSDNGNHLRSSASNQGQARDHPGSGVIACCLSHFLLESRSTLARSHAHRCTHLETEHRRAGGPVQQQ